MAITITATKRDKLGHSRMERITGYFASTGTTGVLPTSLNSLESISVQPINATGTIYPGGTLTGGVLPVTGGTVGLTASANSGTLNFMATLIGI